ncbi:MAG: dimethylarginine dimethylaminohydrolase [Hyphomicrobiales bacterium]|nr:MAG: dimethylarginine dimethylaminohydrolase [Hyphomicrobiales bacterium]
MSARSYSFTHAIMRAPSNSITHGLRAKDTGTPDIAQFAKDHAHYKNLLESTGAKVTSLPALEDYPDSVFVEDAALCLPQGAIIMRPGAPSRLGEATLMKPVLEQFYKNLPIIEAPVSEALATIEGGDILTTEREILVGRSARTNAVGIEALRDIVAPWGYKVREVITPPGVLHFKTDCSLLDENTILATKRLADSGCFAGYKIIHTAPGEEAAANAIRFNQLVLMPAGFPKTAQILAKAGYDVRQVGNTETAKIDGGMSCLSLRFSPPVMQANS